MTEAGKMIKEAREKAGLTQAQVADRLGYTTAQFISNIERGISGLPIKQAGPLAKILKISISAIIAAKLKDQHKRLLKVVRHGRSSQGVSRL